MTKLKKCVIGIVLCLICLLCSAILIFSVADSLQQKSRLEMIGATVEMRLSFWFVADVLVLVVSGLLGAKLVCKNISSIRSKEKISADIVKKKVSDFVLQDIDYGYDEDYGEERDMVSDSTDTSEKVEKKSEAAAKNEENKALRINYGSSKKTIIVKNKDDYNNESEKHDSSEKSSFFSAGGDL